MAFASIVGRVMFYLEVHEPDYIARSISFEGTVRIGRDEENELVLRDHRVSRRHLEIVAEPDGVVARDLGSTHGTLVNGVQAGRQRLVNGDRLQLGSTRLIFREQADPSSTIDVARTSAAAPPNTEIADRRLRLFYEISTKVGATRDGEAFVREMVAGLRQVLGCDRAVVGLGQTVDSGFRSVVQDPNATHDVVISQSVLNAVLVRRERVVFVSNTNADAYPTMVRGRIRAAVCVPIAVGKRVFGFLYVDERREGRTFTSDDEHFLVALGHLAASTLEAAEQLREAEARAAAVANLRRRYGILGKSAAMEELYKKVQICAKSRDPVLIQGESGTGKELIAKALHELSSRAALLPVSINCAAIPDTLIETELFGHKKNTFTGADRDKTGQFVLANKSTLFLDEVGDLSLAAQAKLLRVLQEGEVRPLGAETAIRVDVRIIAATHKDLRKEIAEKRFREDLYYRLSTLRLEVPPLRKRDGDVELLVHELLSGIGANAGKRITGMTPRALEALRQYSWPGNVRELINVLHNIVTFSESPMIDIEDLGEFALPAEPQAMTGQTGSLAERYGALPITEKQLIIEALDKAKGNISAASRLLGISWIMLRRRMERYGLYSDADK